MAIDDVRLEYILNMLSELQQLSREAKADMLCYLIELSIVEARANLHHLRDGKADGPEPSANGPH